jgi:hypothetical protein
MVQRSIEPHQRIGVQQPAALCHDGAERHDTRKSTRPENDYAEAGPLQSLGGRRARLDYRRCCSSQRRTFARKRSLACSSTQGLCPHLSNSWYSSWGTYASKLSRIIAPG